LDDREGYAYAHGLNMVKKFTVFGNRRQFRIICEDNGIYAMPEMSFKIVLHGLTFVPRSYEIDDVEVKVSKRHRKKVLTFMAPQGFRKISIFH